MSALNHFLPRSLRWLLVALALSVVAAACGSDGEPATASDPETDDSAPIEFNGVPIGQIEFFGADDDQCASTVLLNEDGDRAAIFAGAECFLTELEAGNPVVWDLDQPTIEGDPTYTRHLFDGEAVWILNDDRADSFGSGRATSKRCEGAELGRWGIDGVSCVTDNSSGFTGFPEVDS